MDSEGVLTMTNTIRVIDFILDGLPEPIGDIAEGAQNHLRGLVDAYDALAPDWNKAPEWARWYVISSDGTCLWMSGRPDIMHALSEWGGGGAWVSTARSVEIPLGIDWRLCIWRRGC